MATHSNQPDINEDFLAVHGDSIKTLGEGKIGGYLVLFSTADDPDCAGDFFTKETDFDLDRSVKSSVYYAHGLDKTLGKRKIGSDAELKVDEVGVWAEMQLNVRDAYERAIYKMAKAGKLGWSSGTAPHLVVRKPIKGANQIEKWPLGLDASITPAPCEPRTAAMPIKSLTLPEFKELAGHDVEELLTDSLEAIPNMSLKDNFDICLLNIRVMTNRLNDLKQLRESQNRKTPLSKDAVDQLREVETEIKSLLDAYDLAIKATDSFTQERRAKADLVNKVYADAELNLKWLNEII